MKSGDLDLIAFKSVPAIELLDNIYGANESDTAAPRLVQWHFDFQMKKWIDNKVNCEYGLEAN